MLKVFSHTNTYMMSFLILLAFLSFFFLSSSPVSADDSTVTDISITVPLVCTMSSTGMNSHTATINSGTYETNIGTTTLKAYCNDSNGFAIYATGYTGKTIGETNSNKLVGASTNQTITTGTATSGSTSNWAMKLAASGSSYVPTILNGFNSYHAVPNELTKVASYSSTTDIGTGATGSTITTTYQVFISSTQAADAYNGKVIYVMVHPSTYDTPVICNDSATTISEVRCMQDFASVTSANRDAIIASMTPEQQYTLKDKRDGKTYTIAKFQTGTDSNTSDPIYDVWMTKNLDLDLDSSKTYTNLDTDLGYNTSTGTYDTASWSPSSSTLTSANASNWLGSYTIPYSYDPGNLYWNGTASDYTDWGAYFSSCTWNNTSMKDENCNESLNPISTYISSTGTAQYHLGNYYNWTAAVAMNDSSSHTTTNEIIEQSICPAGWTLPRVGDGEDTFRALWEQYGWDSNNYAFSDITNLTGSPLFFAASGYFDGVPGNVGYGGSFWSPVVSDGYGARFASFSVDGYAYPSDGVYRYLGSSVRCIARPVSTTVSNWDD